MLEATPAPPTFGIFPISLEGRASRWFESITLSFDAPKRLRVERLLVHDAVFFELQVELEGGVQNVPGLVVDVTAFGVRLPFRSSGVLEPGERFNLGVKTVPPPNLKSYFRLRRKQRFPPLVLPPRFIGTVLCRLLPSDYP